jgi:hypothetical protein
MGVAQWWAWYLERDLGARPVSSSRGLRILEPMRILVSPSGSILVSLPLCLKLENFIIYASLCNWRIHVITLYSGHLYVYYASILRCCHLVWILIRTDHPCLRVRCHTNKGPEKTTRREWMWVNQNSSKELDIYLRLNPTQDNITIDELLVIGTGLGIVVETWINTGKNTCKSDDKNRIKTQFISSHAF